MEIYRIIDVNLNRAREGIRVLEEVARFGLVSRKLFEEFKHLRHLIKEIEKSLAGNPLWYRDAQNDPGQELSPEEMARNNLREVVLANAKRAQESLRVLEEFGKLLDAAIVLNAKKARFLLYDLEREVLTLIKPSVDLTLYLLTDDAYLNEEKFWRVIEDCLKNGVTAFQYRAKGKKGAEMYREGLRLKELCAKHGVSFFVNDRLDLGIALNADGLHLGQEDLPLEVARKHFPGKIIGLSATNYEEGIIGIKAGADYLGLGPIFPTSTKEDAATPCGVEVIQKLKEEFPNTPVIAIGGIDQEKVSKVIRAGADGIAVISAVFGAESPAKAVYELRETIIKAKE